jgi:hypothetical protein
MLGAIRTVLQSSLGALGYRLERIRPTADKHYLLADESFSKMFVKISPFTMTSLERVRALVDATQYVSRCGIPGAIVECGVWRGGSAMAAALTLLELDDPRDIYLFDTFAGMTEPHAVDVDFRGIDAEGRFRESLSEDGSSQWCYASLEEVRRNLLSTGYPEKLLHFVKGGVEETIPQQAPETICLLRLDTDWYDSTIHELTHLYPKLTSRGIMIIDDYGHWQGCKKAVDEFFGSTEVFLHRIDYTGRLLIKP